MQSLYILYRTLISKLATYKAGPMKQSNPGLISKDVTHASFNMSFYIIGELANINK